MNQPPVLQFHIPLAFAEAEHAVREALQAQGFGILTEVDVAAVFRAKLGIDTPARKLLGACNARLAHASLEAEPAVAAFLPCGLALWEGPSPGETLVSVQNPQLIAQVFDAPGLRETAQAALAGIRDALLAVSGASEC